MDFFIVSQKRRVYIPANRWFESKLSQIRHRHTPLVAQRILPDHLTVFFRFIPLAQVSLRGSMKRALGNDSSLYTPPIEVFCQPSMVLSAGHVAPFLSAKNHI